MKVKGFRVKAGHRDSRNLMVAPIVLSMIIPAVANSRVLFEESFDELPDYTSSEELDLPGWSFRRNGEVTWSPETGYPDKHDAFEIMGSNSEKARGGGGKSFVAWRESYNPGWKQWNSDGILAKYFESGFEQLYVSFYIRFGENWTPSGTSKLFRIYSWNADGSPFQFFRDGNAGPIFIWDYSRNNYGIRNVHAYRGGPHGENYQMDNSDIPGLPRNLVNLGDASYNFTEDTRGMSSDGSDPEIADLSSGGLISDDMSQTVTHEQIFGSSDNWTKVAFFVKMNSSPGANDGVLIQWINDEKIFVNRNINWVGENSGNIMVDWNVVAIGGNDFFREYPNSERREEWYSIDDLFISTEIPDDAGDSLAAPNPPTGLGVTESN